jgi:simple sugar transport system permease protein
MLKRIMNAVGWPRIIIGFFLFSLFAATPFVGVSLGISITNTLERFGMNAVMVLAMVPMVQSGCGLNFGLPLGIISGLLGATISIELGLTNMFGFVTAICIAALIATVLGYFYGQLLNRVKGDEMMIATYVGFSSVAFMCIAWLLLPYRSPTMIWPYGGSGLRTTISVSGYWERILSGAWTIKFGHLVIPTGMFIFMAFMCFLVWLCMKTKTGTAMTAVGSNSEFARAGGVNIDRMRIVSVILSTILGAVGILVYEQSFGFIQLYMGPLYMAFYAVAAILLGGASVNKASIWNVLIGTFLFQGICTMTPLVINNIVKTDITEIIRMIVSNGMIIYALTRKAQVKR